MTPQEFDALPDREVDALIAEKVMGYQWALNCLGERYLESSTVILKNQISRAEGNEAIYRSCYVPDYSTNLNAVWDMEEALAKKGLAYEYVKHLWEMFELKPPNNFFGWEANFMQVHATARQKCKAALMAVGFLTEEGEGKI